ncbi:MULTISPECIES: CU044_5270 family protein [unclassified Nonomuraea]|uniref:CU044_5270 family protein n=1 Tax=unclassified Nonomuraea TaxID=2593643 RepID=UPI0034007E60
MNDLDTVRDLRSQVRQSEERDLNRARQRLLAAMAPERPARRTRRTMLRVVAVGALGLTITAGVTVVQTSRTNDDGKMVAGAPAWLGVANAETLARRATAAAADKPDVYPRADQWVYVKSVYASRKMTAGSQRTVEMWTRGDGKERARREDGKTIIRRQGGEDHRLRFDPAYLSSLPLEPSALRERLKKDTAGVGGLPEGSAIRRQVLAILQEGTPGPRLRAALYSVLSQLDGVGVEKVSDLLGRAGVALYVVDDFGTRHETIIDPDTYALLGGRQVDVGGSGSPTPNDKGEVIFSVARVHVGIVDRVGDVPR